MPIASPIGYLDVVNATLRASQVEAVSRLSVANTATTQSFSVGERFHVNKDSVDPVSITGNVVASGVKIGNLSISPAFDFASVSNVGNVTANVIQFANATTGFTTTANVEIGGNIGLTANAQVKIGSNVLAEYTGPHPREPKEVPLKKYPEIAFDASKMDGNETTNTYTQAGYTVTASSQYTERYGPWRAFNHKAHASDEPGWATSTSSSLYDETTGQATSNATLFDGNRGEYIDLKLPHKIKVSHFTIRTRLSAGHSPNDQPGSGHLYGSDNGADWVKLTSYSGLTYQGNREKGLETVTVNATEYYNYLRLTATARVAGVSGSSWVDIGELEYYGYEEPAPPGDLSLDTTIKSTFNSVRSNNYVMYFDGEGFDPNDTNSNNLVTGSSVSVVHHNATYDSTGKYWTLDGSTESNVTTGDLGFEGDVPHTVSMWVNSSNVEDKQLFTIGSGYDKALVRVDDTQIAANTWHNVTYAYQGEGGSKVTYVDGRKVEEAQVEDTFGEYPPFAMTDYETGGFRVSASNEDSSDTYFAWKVFDDGTGSIPQVGWFSDQLGNYNGTNGTVTPTSTVRLAPETEKGEWLQLEFPYFFHLDSFTIFSQSDSQTTHTVDNLIVYAKKGPNDTWTSLGTFTGIAARQSASGVSEAVNANEMYKYFAIVITKRHAQHSTDGVSIRELKLYGHKEGDLTRFPEPTRVLKYPHIPMSGPAQRGYVASASAEEIGNSRFAWSIFDEDDNTQWGSGNATYGADPYNVNTNLAITLITLADSTTRRGHWIKLELPRKLYVTSYYQKALVSTRRPDSVCILGSNDDSNWYVIKDSHSVPNQDENTISVNAGTAYKYIKYVVESISGADDRAVVNTVKFYGTQEDTGTPAIVGGPFAGKVANFRVYDTYLGEERIQEIYDAQKDAFGHKKSSMTFYKGRIGVGTTEPEGALTVVDEPHALAKFPERAISSDDGEIKLSAADGSGYQAFDGLTSTSWDASPERHTRLSEEVDFGAWLKMETPESISLKKAEIASNPYWRQVGSTINDSAEHAANSSAFGMALDCTDDGTRIIVGAYVADVGGSDRGQAFVFDWNGSEWVRVGNIFQGTQDGEQLGYAVAISGDGNYVAVGSNLYHDGSTADVGRYAVFYLDGSTWTLVPDSGSLTSTLQNYFLGTAANDRAGWSLSLSHDGKTIAAGYRQLVSGAGGDAGQIRVHTYANGAWTQKGQNLNGLESGDRLGNALKITPDGNHLIADASYGLVSAVYVYDYNSSSSQWVKRTTLTHPTLPSTDTHDFGAGVAISDDGNTVAVGAPQDDTDGTNWGRVYVYTWSGLAWTLVSTLESPRQGTDNEYFGTAVDLSGDGTRLVVAAAYEYNEQGYAFTYEYTGGTWQLRGHTTIGSAGVSTDGRLGEFYTGLIISRDGSTIVGGDRAGYEGKVRVWNMPSNIKSIWGSNDDVNWTKITTGNKTFRFDDRLEFKNLDNPNYYKYHAIVADAFTRLKDIKLFGVRKQGSSTLHDGALTLAKNLTVPRIGPALDADDTPRRDRLVVEYNTSTNPMEDGVVQDTSGRGNDGAFYGGASYNATEKALVFDGVDDHTRSGILTNMSGDKAVSYSLWIKADTLVNTMIVSLGEAGVYGIDGKTGGVFMASTGTLYNTVYGNGIQVTGAITVGSWIHIVATKIPGGSGITTQTLYVNGVKPTQSNWGTAGTSLSLDDPVITLGASPTFSQRFDGAISNFKLYDTALTAQEVKTLYDMGRCDEGHHVVNFSKTRVGIGLGDGEAPQAALDVRGPGLRVMGDIIGRPVSKTRTITKGTSLSGQVDTFTLELDENRIVLNNDQGSAAYSREYTANFNSGVPTAIGTIIDLEINSSRHNSSASGINHRSEIQFNGVTVLGTGNNYLAPNGGSDSYQRNLKRTIILSSSGWVDYSLYPKISIPVDDDAIIFSTTNNNTKTSVGSDNSLTETMRVVGGTYPRVNIGNAIIQTFSGSDTKGNLGQKYLTALGPGAGLIYMHADYQGYDRTGTQLISFAIGKNVTGGNAVVSKTTQNSHYSSTTNFNPYIHLYSASGDSVSLYFYGSSGDRSNSGTVSWKVSVIRLG